MKPSIYLSIYLFGGKPLELSIDLSILFFKHSAQHRVTLRFPFAKLCGCDLWGVRYVAKPVGMNITRRPPQGLRPSQPVGLSLLRVPSATHSPGASRTAAQPVQRTHPSRMPTGLVPNSSFRPFRAHGTVHHLRASKAISAPRPDAQTLAGAPAGPRHAPLRAS